jgi:hypothetical protein
MSTSTQLPLPIPDMQAPTSVAAWGRALADKWPNYAARARQVSAKSRLGMLVAAVLGPLADADGNINPKGLLKILEAVPDTGALLTYVRRSAPRRKTPYQLTDLAEKWATEALGDEDFLLGLERLLLTLDVPGLLNPKSRNDIDLARGLTEEMWQHVEAPSALRVVAEQISAGEIVAIAGGNINIVLTDRQAERDAVNDYLADLRATWDQPELSRMFPAYGQKSELRMRLHSIYTQMDVWREGAFEKLSGVQLMERRAQAVRKDLSTYRRPVLESVAANRLLVLTGDAGYGKSSLARYIAVALAFACDPESEKAMGVKGLDMLGVSWIHGPLLPIYVGLQEFAASKYFPKPSEKAGAGQLVAYIRGQVGAMRNYLKHHLLRRPDPAQPYHTMLILDGLDEVRESSERMRIRKIVEDWANRFTGSRVLLTSRTYAYRQEDEWRLSDRFASAELAPYTRVQMKSYIRRWYANAALTRAASMGGKSSAERHTQRLADDLCLHAERSEALLPMMRQPLLLAMLTLMHETQQRLPSKRAELYESAIQLLYRWTPIARDPIFGKKLANLNHSALMHALKLAAFELQVKQETFQTYPSALRRSALKRHLRAQNRIGEGLRCDIEDLLDYLGSRNGVLLPVLEDAYRFPHLSVQEYLAACALIELYDECGMPPDLVPPDTRGWAFPANLVALLARDPYRWRHVAMMVGAVAANNKGQDGRWTLIDHLLPVELPSPITEEVVFRIYIAAEIWAEDWLKARQPAQDFVKARLRKQIIAIRDNEFLDAPELQRLTTIMRRISTHVARISDKRPPKLESGRK